jgi:hypothetical protein
MLGLKGEEAQKYAQKAVSGAPENINVKNRDCSVIIDGHLAYRNHINLLAKLFNMKDD